MGLLDILSPYIISIVLTWLVADVAKHVIRAKKTGKYNIIKNLFVSGDMPSGHSAMVASAATIIGLKDGFSSGLFSLAALFAFIVMYDAVKVRRSSGEQGAAIHELIKETKSGIELPRAAKGHTPIEVVIGALLGVGISVVVFLATR